jgi:hypothetical protein
MRKLANLMLYFVNLLKILINMIQLWHRNTIDYNVKYINTYIYVSIYNERYKKVKVEKLFKNKIQ